jgi:hypothetical protein
MKIKVHFCREIDPEFILQGNKISRQVWEGEFKNILNVGRVWLKFKEEKRPFRIPMKEKRYRNILPGDIIQIANDFYMASQVG